MCRLALGVCLFGVLASQASVGWAGTKSFYVDRGDLLDNASSPSGSVYGVILNNGAVETVRFALVLPNNYKKNTKIKLRLFLLGEEASCNFRLAGSSVTRSRTGKVTTSLLASTGGLEPSAFVDVPSPATINEGFFKDFTLSPAASGPLVNTQKPGDRIQIRIARDGIADTCSGTLIVEDIKVTYTTP